MEYPCKSVNMSKMLLTNKGPIEPLCTKCKSEDCKNSVEIRKISIFGIVKEHRFLIRGTEPMCVIQCDGYIG